MPKKPTIEELLEASAKARREAFGKSPQMPNPMRARLQEEVARRNNAAPASVKQSLFSLWFSRVAIATAVILIIGLPVLLQFRPSVTPSDFAPVTENSLNLPKPEKAAAPGRAISRDQVLTQTDLHEAKVDPDKEPQKLAAESPSPTSSPAVMVKSSGQDASTAPANLSIEAPTVASLGRTAAGSTPAPPQGSQPALDAKVALPASTSPALAGAKPENAPVLNAPTLTLNAGKFDPSSIALAGKAVQTEPQALSQRFANSVPTQASLIASRGGANNNQQANFANRAIQSKAKQNAPLNVMQTFDFQQNGNQIRVIDSDGSTYSGEIASGGAKDNRVKQIQNSSNAISFRALGSNNTLNKTVVFEGSYIAPNPPEQSKNQTLNQQQAPSRILGVAKVHGGPEIEVDALPAK